VVGSGTSTIRANLSGSDVVIVAGVNNRVGFSLFTTPKTRSWEDLRGKTLGVTAIGSSSDIALRYVLKQQGLIPGKDVRILAIGGHREALAAMKQELIAGGMITVLFKPIARGEGYREHIDLSTSGLELQTSAIVTTRRFAETEGEVIRRFLLSYIEAIYAYKTRKAEAKEIIAKYSRVSNPETLEQNYVYYLGILKENPVPTLAGLKVEQEMMAETDPKAREYDLRRAVDLTFLQQIEASGFVRKLYGGGRQ
jgi:ABC-type nitrate/sulfonate/bicarbonate transport system substrate-binding protein